MMELRAPSGRITLGCGPRRYRRHGPALSSALAASKGKTKAELILAAGDRAPLRAALQAARKVTGPSRAAGAATAR
jgi:hypothetical protein